MNHEGTKTRSGTTRWFVAGVGTLTLVVLAGLAVSFVLRPAEPSHATFGWVLLALSCVALGSIARWIVTRSRRPARLS